MPLDASSMDDNMSIVSAISSIFDGDSSAEIDQLRTHRRILYSDAMRLQTEYRRYLHMSVDEQEDNCYEFDAFKAEWVSSLRRYIDSARTMYSAKVIPMPHFRAVAKSVDRLVRAWNASPYVTKDAAARCSLPSVDDILEATAHDCAATPTPHSGHTALAAASTLKPPSGPPSGPNIAAWLEDAEKSSTSGAKLPRECTVEAEVEAGITARTPEMFSLTNNASLSHIPTSNTPMFDLFDGLKNEMERLVQENEQLKRQLANAASIAAARANVKKDEEKLREAAIQRAEKAEREKDELIDGFIRTRIQHLASHRQSNGNPPASHQRSRIDTRKKNLQNWLASLQGKTDQESLSISGVHPSFCLGTSFTNETSVAAL